MRPGHKSTKSPLRYTVVRDPAGTLVAMSWDLNGLYANSASASSLVTTSRSKGCLAFTHAA